MKKLAFTLLALFAVSLAVPAQNKQGRHKHKAKAIQQLNLAPEQKEKAKVLHKEFKEKKNALEKNDGITVREYRLKRDALRREHKEKMQALLTPEQKNQVAAAREKVKMQRQQRHTQRMEKLGSRLNLTNAQKEKMKTGQEAVKAKRIELKNNNSYTREQKKEMIQQMKKKNKESFLATLSPEQKKQLTELKKNHKPKRMAK